MNHIRALLIRVGALQAKLVLGAFYFTILAPFALAARLFSDPLDLRHPGFWERDDAPEDRAEQQH